MKFRLQIIAACAALLLAPVAGLAADKEAPATKAKPAAKEVTEARKTEASCKAPTGSRIQSKKKSSCEQASNSPTRSYTAEELQATGKIDMVEALQQLNPAVQ